MSKSHKGLPADSQGWADEVDALMAEVKQLRDVVKRLSANAGIDYSNPQRGINSAGTPSVKNPVNQKLSSLADTDIYNVADGQYLAWNQKGQKWLPVTPPTASAGGTVDISAVSYGPLTSGYGVVTSGSQYAYNAAGVVFPYSPTEPQHYIENWTTGSHYVGSGDWNTGTGYSLIELSPGDGFGRPFITLEANDFADGTAAYVTVSSYQLRLNGATLEAWAVTTAGRPPIVAGTREGASVYDFTLKKPIWWNGTSWRDALGNAV